MIYTFGKGLRDLFRSFECSDKFQIINLCANDAFVERHVACHRKIGLDFLLCSDFLEKMSTEKKERIVLWAILLVALMLRLWRIDWGFPFVYWVDEDVCTQHGIYCAVLKSLDPQTFGYPSLIFYIAAMLGSIGWAITNLFGGNVDWNTFFLSYFGDATTLGLLGRSFSAAVGTLTVAAVYKIGKFFSTKTALFGALIFALSPVAFEQGHRFTPDGIQALFCTLSIFWAMRYYDDVKNKHWLFSAFFAGLAAGSKYVGGLVLIAVWTAEFLRTRSFRKLFTSRVFWLSWILSVSIFALTTPYSILHPIGLIVGLGQGTSHMLEGHFGFEKSPIGGIFNIYNLTYAYGFIGTIALFVGLIFAKKARKPIFWVLAAFPIAYYAMTFFWQASFARYIFPFIPVATVFVGFAFDRLINWRKGFSVIFGISILELCVYCVLFCRYLTLPHTCDMAREYVSANIPAKASTVDVMGRRFFIESDSLLTYRRAELQDAKSVDTLYLGALEVYVPEHYKRNVYSEGFFVISTGLGESIKNKAARIMGRTRNIPRAPENILEGYDERQIDYFVASSNIYLRYNASPEIYPEFVNFYTKLAKMKKRVAQFGEETDFVGREIPPFSQLWKAQTAGPRIIVYSLH